MWRIGIPTIFMISAALLLGAGAFGDLPSWRTDWPVQIPRLTDLASFEHFVRMPSRPDSKDRADQTNDARARQARELEAQIAQATRDLAALRADTEQARRDLIAARHRREEAQSAPNHTGAPGAATTGASPGADAPPAQPPRPAQPAQPVRNTAEPVRPDTPPTALPVPPPVTAPSAAPRDAGPAPVPHVVVAQLTQARAALSSGRGSQARRHLRYLRSQMARLPAAASDRTETGEIRGQVEYAIALLGHGDQGGAMQSINHALAMANGDPVGAPFRNGRSGPGNGPS